VTFVIDLILMVRNQRSLSFVPASIIALLAEGTRKYDVRNGSVLFADVAGFTPLTEALLVLGREGSEELTRILNRHFTSMIEITDRYGGDVLRFAGDAMTVFFPDDEGPSAVSCGIAMLEKMKEYSKVESRAGDFELAMKIGCAAGPVQIGVVGPPGGADYYALGEPLDASADAEHHAQRGDLVVSPSVKVPGAFETSSRGEGFSLVAGIPLPPPSRKPSASKAKDFDPAEFLPPYMIDQAQPGVMGEHRGTTVIFLSFPTPSGSADEIHSSLSHRYEETLSIVKKYGGILNKLDFGDKGAKAVILFGAPVACENREEMAVRAALEIMALEGNRGSLRMGLTSSHLFSGPLGSPSRREFTVMGDGINLSARLMGYAKPGEVIADQPTHEKASGAVVFRDRGEISVKGKSGLIRIFEPASVREETRETGGRKLYGREALQQEIKEWLLSEDRVPLAVLGEIGSGKSAMADWLFREARAREYGVQRIELQPFSRDMFFSLFSRLLKKVFEIKSAGDLPKLLPLIPSVSREFAPLLLPYFGYEETADKSLEKLGPKDRRDIAYSMLLALFDNIEDTVFIIDNLSFADQASLDFLSYAVSNSEKKLLDVAAFSRMEITGSATFEIFRRVVELPPLEREHLREFISEEFRIRSASDPVLKFLEEKSKGNPRLITALVASMNGEGLISEKDGVSYVDEDRLFRTLFPDSLEAIYLKEFDRLEVRQKQMLFEASVFGTNVSVNLVDKLGSFREKEIREMSGELSGKGFIRIDDSGKRPYMVFSDTLLYEAIYNLAPFSLKRDLHKNIFNKLLEIEGDGKPSLLPYLAHHSEKAGDRDNAVKFHRLAGRYYLEKYDNISAMKHFDFIFQNDAISADYFKDAFSLMDIYLGIGKFNEMTALLEKLWPLKENMDPRSLSSLYNLESEKNIRERDVQKAEDNLIQSLKIATENNDHFGMARALLNLVGRVYGPTGRHEEGKKSLEILLALPKYKDISVFKVVALMNLGLISRFNNDRDKALLYYSKALRSITKWKLFSRKTAVYCNMITTLYEMGCFSKSIMNARKAMMISEALSQRDLILDILEPYSLSLWAKGKTSEAIRLSKKAFHISTIYQKPYFEGMSQVILGVSEFEELMFAESLKNISESVSHLEMIGCHYESFSSKLEYLRLLKFLRAEERFNVFQHKWGGKDILFRSACSLGLPKALISVLDPSVVDKKQDLDGSFILWLENMDHRTLEVLYEFLKFNHSELRYDLQIKWTWAYLSKDLEPPYNPMRLLSKSPGGIFGLRILAILWRQNFKAGKTRKAQKIRKLLLDRLYFARIHSDDRIWECVIKDGDIAAAIRGTIPANPIPQKGGLKTRLEKKPFKKR